MDRPVISHHARSRQSAHRIASSVTPLDAKNVKKSAHAAGIKDQRAPRAFIYSAEQINFLPIRVPGYSANFLLVLPLLSGLLRPPERSCRIRICCLPRAAFRALALLLFYSRLLREHRSSLRRGSFERARGRDLPPPTFREPLCKPRFYWPFSLVIPCGESYGQDSQVGPDLVTH